MLIFLDLETTGLSSKDKICSIALLFEDAYIYELVNEGKKIPPEASSIHHITNEMLKEKPKFLQTQSFKKLMECNERENILIGHNIAFDLEMLAQSGFVWEGRVIDTLRLTKHLISECELFGLQFLRYELRLYKQEKSILEHYGIKDALVAHNALFDAFIIKLLFEYHKESVDFDAMVRLSQTKVLLQKLSFGKYRACFIEEIALSDRAYLEWMLHKAEIDEDLRYSLEYYLEESR
jgi:DNA polymerase-3 subunit epsilon/exodeoxyribonuclease X